MGKEQSVRMILHVGPQKTGSSSLQELLGSHRDALSENAIFVPPGVNEEYPGHHMVSYRLLGRTLLTLGGSDVEDLVDLFSNWLTAAIDRNCDVIVISAEDLSILSESAWNEFGQVLTQAQELSGVNVGALNVVVVQRDSKARARSGANELVKHGATAPISQLMKKIGQDDKVTDKIMGKLPRLLPLPTVVTYVPFEGDNLLRRWIAQVLGDNIVDILPATAFDVVVNLAMADGTIEELRKFNELNSPTDPARAAYPLPPPVTDEEVRAFGRLGIVRWALAERDFYYKEMNRLAYRVEELEGN